MEDLSFWYSWVIELKKKVEKSHPQKRLEFRVGSNWLNFCWLNFGGCQLCIHLSQAFLHQFSKFLCPSSCKFPEFFLNIPNILNLHGFEGCYGQKTKKPKVRKNANLSQLWNFSFFMVRFLNFFFQFHVPGVPE